jgi:hypothetical protein
MRKKHIVASALRVLTVAGCVLLLWLLLEGNLGVARIIAATFVAAAAAAWVPIADSRAP